MEIFDCSYSSCRLATLEKDRHIFSADMPLRFMVWGIILVIFLVDAVGFYRRDITVVLGDTGWGTLRFLGANIGFCSLLYGLSYLLSSKWSYPFAARAMHSVAALTEAIALFICFSLGGLAFSYICAGIIYPYQDQGLLYADGLIGFSWKHYAHWVNDRPALARILFLAYNSFVPQLFVLFGILATLGRFRTIYELMLALLISSVICTVISTLLPAIGIITYLHISPDDYKNVPSGPGYLHVPILKQLRFGIYHTLTISEKGLTGLITFPSYHACISTLLIWVFSSLPWIRWVALILNIALLFSVPVIGGHYLIDVPAGIIMATITIFWVQRITDKG